jgi:hypothetical protein
VTLQPVHTEINKGRACSLCCYWIQLPGDSAAGLQAICIDQGIAEFERQFEMAQRAEKEFLEFTSCINHA